VKAARPRSEPEVSRGNTGIDSNLGEGRAVTLEPYPTTSHRLNEGENTRLRHYLARLHRKTLCYSCISRNVKIICEPGCLLPKT
jgi:hypothetical protein